MRYITNVMHVIFHGAPQPGHQSIKTLNCDNLEKPNARHSRQIKATGPPAKPK